MALARQLGKKADEGELAFVRLTEIELHHPDFPVVLVADRTKLDVRMLDDLGEMRVVQKQAREPQPGRPNEPEEVAIMFGLRDFDAFQSQG